MNQRTRSTKPAAAPAPAPQQAQVLNIGGQPQTIDVNALMRQMRAQQSVYARKIGQLTEETTAKEVDLEIMRVDVKNANERADVINIRNIVLNNALASMLENGVITDEQFAAAMEDAEKSMRHFNNDPNVLRIMESNSQHVMGNMATFRQEYAQRIASEKGGKGAAN